MRSRLTLASVAEALAEAAGNMGCQGCLGMLLVTLLGVAWVIAHRRQIAHGGFSIFVATLIVGVLYLGITRWLPQLTARRTKRALDANAGPTPIADLKPGHVHTAGLVTSTTPLRTPFENHPCVYYELRIETADDDQLVYSARSADELSVGDGGGAKLVVKLEGAKWKIDREHVVEDGRVASYVTARGVPTLGLLRARIKWIEAHELVFLRGDVERIGPNDANYRTSATTAELVMRATTIALEDIT